MKTRYEMTENVKENKVLDCPNHRDKSCILSRLKKIKFSSSLVKSLKSKTDEELEMDKLVLPEIEHLKGKVTDDQLETIKNVLDRNQDVFSRHKADIGCCNFDEHEIELEKSAVPHKEGRGA